MSLLIALGVVNALLIAPVWLRMGTGGPWLALEAPLIVLPFALLRPTRAAVGLAAVVASAVIATAGLALADAVARDALGRPLNVYLDLRLARSVLHLMTGAFGLGLTTLAVAGGTIMMAATAWGLTRLLSRSEARWDRLAQSLAAVLALLSLTSLVSDDPPPLERRAAMPAVELLGQQTRHLRRMLTERAVFAAELAEAPASYAQRSGLLARLEGRDVLLAFVESYGVSAIDDPRYAPVITPRLDRLAQRLDQAGLHVATGQLVAPTQGGQSWFSHLSILSGLWIDNQLRYDLLLSTGRETLIDDFRRTGHRTVALMPANTLAWPEGERLGYDEILGRDDIHYAGPALNWVTMPDQFTWSYLQRRVRQADDPRPVFVELGLISSHAPWTPILPVLDDWDAIGDGAVFEPWRDAGLRPRDLWLDHDRVREHFARAVAYAIDVVTGYAERFVDDQTLLIVMGDHQPAPLITGEAASRAVPVHAISGDPTMLAPFRQWGFLPGTTADPAQPPQRMDAFRDWFVDAFSEP